MQKEKWTRHKHATVTVLYLKGLKNQLHINFKCQKTFKNCFATTQISKNDSSIMERTKTDSK